MFNETVKVQEAIDRLRDEFDDSVLATCRELIQSGNSGTVPEEMPVVELLRFVHRADDIVHRVDIEAAAYAQTNGFNSDP